MGSYISSTDLEGIMNNESMKAFNIIFIWFITNRFSCKRGKNLGTIVSFSCF